jgi:altronate dehydratase small subunit
MTPRCFQIHPNDNVATLLDDAPIGPVEQVVPSKSCRELTALEPIARGHKIALTDLSVGAAVIKFGSRIGHCIQPVQRGGWVHLHNLASDLDQRSSQLDRHTGAPTDTASAYA